MQKFIYPTPEEERIQILKEHGEPYDRRIREHECANRTGLSRSRRWVLEQEGAFPARAHLGKVSVSWLLSDVLWWVMHPPGVKEVNSPYKNANK